MNKIEAIRAMCDGKKVRRESWDDAEFLKMVEDGQIVDEHGFDEDINEYNDDDDWQIYEEPKPKVTYEDAIKNLRKLKIETPLGEIPCFESKQYDFLMLLLADLADRKGYRMEVVE